HHQHPREELLDRLVQALTPERRIDLLRLRRRLDLCAERNREQRQPRREVREHCPHPRRQLRARRRCVEVWGDSGERTQQRAEDEVRRRRGVRVTARRKLREAERLTRQLFDKARLADARLTDELDESLLPHARCVDGLGECLKLALATNERELRRRLVLLLP